MKNTLMLALVVSAPFAVRAMEPADELKKLETGTAANADSKNDPLEHLKALFEVNTEVEVANNVRKHIANLEQIAEADLIKALTFLGQKGKLAEVHQVVAATRAAPVASAEPVNELQAALAKAEAMAAQAKAAVTIATTIYALITDPNNQQKIEEIDTDIAQAAGLLPCCVGKAAKK